jgi:hypothetical protein
MAQANAGTGPAGRLAATCVDLIGGALINAGTSAAISTLGTSATYTTITSGPVNVKAGATVTNSTPNLPTLALSDKATFESSSSAAGSSSVTNSAIINSPALALRSCAAAQLRSDRNKYLSNFLGSFFFSKESKRL